MASPTGFLELSPKVGDGGNREGGISWGCLTPPLLHQRSDMPCPTIRHPSDSARNLRRSTHRSLAQRGPCPSRQGGRGRGRRLSRPACRFEDPGRPPARRPPRSPAGARGDDRYRSGRRPPAACTRSRGRRCRSWPHPVLAVDPAALHAPLEVDRDAAADPISEGYLDRRLLRGAGGAAWQDAAGLSASAIGRLKDGWLDEHTAWQKRDLSAKRYVYIWADGIHLEARLEDEKQCILVLIGATPEGRKELVGFTDGARENAQDWRDLLLDLKRRGLEVPPRLVIADGALGFWKAAGEVWPKTREQRCWVHKTANVLAKLPKSQQPKAKRALQEIWMAETKAAAVFRHGIRTPFSG